MFVFSCMKDFLSIKDWKNILEEDMKSSTKEKVDKINWRWSEKNISRSIAESETCMEVWLKVIGEFFKKGSENKDSEWKQDRSQEERKIEGDVSPSGPQCSPNLCCTTKFFLNCDYRSM